MMRALVALLLLSGMSLAQDATKVPTGSPPRLIRVARANLAEGGLVVSDVRQVPVNVVEERTVVVGGRAVVEKVTVTKFQSVVVQSTISIKGATFETAGGDKLKLEEAEKRLLPGALVVTSADGLRIDPGYLRVFKNDTVVIQPGAPMPVLPREPMSAPPRR